ncbi:hypothetical protein Dimus_018011, partial [Dionaea muscipula]
MNSDFTCGVASSFLCLLVADNVEQLLYIVHVWQTSYVLCTADIGRPDVEQLQLHMALVALRVASG